MREGRFLSSSLREFLSVKIPGPLALLLESFEKCLIYYFDVPFQTTIERHRTRPQRAFFSESSLQKVVARKKTFSLGKTA